MSPQEIVRACIQANFTQEQIAAESGVPQATISRILTGAHSDPRNSTVEKLREFYLAKVEGNDAIGDEAKATV